MTNNPERPTLSKNAAYVFEAMEIGIKSEHIIEDLRKAGASVAEISKAFEDAGEEMKRQGEALLLLGNRRIP